MSRSVWKGPFVELSLMKKIISKEDIAQIKIQKISRKLAKEIIPNQFELYAIVFFFLA